MSNVALIVAAGKGGRFGGSAPKQYQLLNGKPVLQHSIEAFLNHPDIDEVRVVIAADDKFYNFNVPSIIGGAERQDSVRLGLESIKGLKPKNILIHDAARPYVSKQVIDNVLAGLEKHQAVIPVIPASDSARYDGTAVERDKLKLVQTPQGFNYETILAAHQKAKGKNITDDAQVAELAGVKIHFVEGEAMNKKITTKGDLAISSIRVGQGFDVHAFETGTHVIICGIKIPHTHQLKGHSDADVGLHALTDAILGAIGEGDIGEHFPDSKPEWRNVDSAVFVQHAVKLVAAKNARIENVDVTIICEEPKLTPYKPQMRKRVAEMLGLAENCVNIKATTTEKLGFTGRKEGIAAQAIVSINF